MIRLLEEAFKRLKVERLRRERMKNSKPSVSQFAKYVCKVLGIGIAHINGGTSQTLTGFALI